MKIVSWNCNGGFRRKFPILLKLSADIYVIQECENPFECNHKAYTAFARNSIWTGNNQNKGLGVFAAAGISLNSHCWSSFSLRHFLPVRIDNHFDMLAVWAGRPYIEEYAIYQSIHYEKYSKDMIIIGDFNSNALWDKQHPGRNHSKIVTELRKKGLVSAYHWIRGEAQGAETQKTFYLHKNGETGYHIDHCFIDPDKINRYQILVDNEWLTYSDHLPVMIDARI